MRLREIMKDRTYQEEEAEELELPESYRKHALDKQHLNLVAKVGV